MKIEKSRLFVFEGMIFSWCWTAVQKDSTLYHRKKYMMVIKNLKQKLKSCFEDSILGCENKGLFSRFETNQDLKKLIFILV